MAERALPVRRIGPPRKLAADIAWGYERHQKEKHMAVRKKKETIKAAPAAAPKANGTVAQQEIAARAYRIWERSGRRHGDDRAHWLQAERELRGS